MNCKKKTKSNNTQYILSNYYCSKLVFPQVFSHCRRQPTNTPKPPQTAPTTLPIQPHHATRSPSSSSTPRAPLSAATSAARAAAPRLCPPQSTSTSLAEVASAAPTTRARDVDLLSICIAESICNYDFFDVFPWVGGYLQRKFGTLGVGGQKGTQNRKNFM